MILRREGRALLVMLSVAGLAAGLSGCTLLPSAAPVNDSIFPAWRAPAGDGRPGAPAATQPEWPATTQPGVSQAGPLAVTVEQAIVLALERNQSLRVQRLAPSIRRTFEQEQRAAFDPEVSIEAAHSRVRAPIAGELRETSRDTNLGVAVSQSLPTGTDVSVGLTADVSGSDLRDDRYVSRLGLTLNQALLRGAGLGVNLASVRQGRLDTLASEYELRGVAEAIIARCEEAYWDCALAERTIEIVTNSLKLAEKQLEEITERVKVGRLAETELAAAEAELARRRENLINARSGLAAARLRLLRLVNPGPDGAWGREVVLQSAPAIPAAGPDDVDVYVQVALRMRPELNQARLGVQRGDLELVKTRNGLLPRLDLFISLGMSGYAESFGDGFSNMRDGDYDVLAGVRFEFPPANRAAEARHRRAVFSREQALQAVENLAQIVQLDVRTAHIEVQRTREQVAATAATRRHQEETLRAETEKFRVGKSTSFLVAQAQRDLLESQIGEVRAVVSYLKALVGLHLQQGALLERRGIAAPGATPVDPAGPRR